MKQVSEKTTYPKRYSNTALPMSFSEMKKRRWDDVDVVFVTGDAYVDHPSFAMAVLGRVLEREGFRVAIVSQPDWHDCQAWKQFGRPRLFFAVSAGNMDSMLNHYTANRKVRNDDAYSPGGKIGLRPDRATLSYCQRAREAFPGVPVIAGGVEASLRRFAHYDYWSDTVRSSILLDSKADLLVYGMGEAVIVEIARRLAKGESIKSLHGIRGTAYALGASESLSEKENTTYLQLPSFEDVKKNKEAFLEATRFIHRNTNPYNAKTLVQYHGKRPVVVNPPSFPISQSEMDGIYDLPYTRQPHPSYKQSIPAFEMIKNSITLMRGCFGGCSFCSITLHQGHIVQSRSHQSVQREVRRMAKDPYFKGMISDVGGPTANMYEMRCTKPEVEKNCRRQSCVYPSICKLLNRDHSSLIQLLRKIQKERGVKKAFVASGIRMDLAGVSPSYIKEIASHHVGGYLKVAPEHSQNNVLHVMKKPPIENFLKFASQFQIASRKAGKAKQYVIPYFMSGHPGCDLNDMIELAVFLKSHGYRPDQIQDFVPVPMDIATCVYYTGRDPFTKKPIHVARGLTERKMQRALLHYFKPENYFEVRKALEQAGRLDLMGEGREALIPSHPPRNPSSMPRKKFESSKNATAANTQGYRPGRKTARRRNRTVPTKKS